MTYLTSDRKESIWNWLQLIGILGFLVALFGGLFLFMQGFGDAQNKQYNEIENMSCDELREFILTHGNLALGFQKAEKEFKYRPCE